MYLMQTVSTIPRVRPSSAPRSRSMDRATEMAAATNNQSPFAVPPRHRRPSDELVGESKKDSGSGKRWSLGSLFRRRRKKSDAADSPDTSSEDEEARSGGFLSRRRSRRDAKHAKKKVVGTFDHVVVNPLMRPPQPPQQQPQQPATSPQPQQQQDVNGSASPRPGDSLSSRSSSKDWPPPQQQVSQSQQHRRQESSGSGSVEGGGAVSTTRRGRLDQVKARVEASRLRAADSSSDDDLRPAVTTRSSDDSLSLSKRSRGARTERYIRRMEAAGGRWQQQESASASASPAHSPLIRPRHLRAAGPQEQTAATFPPGALLGGRHAAAPQLPRAPPSPNSRVTAWHGLHSSSHDNIYGRTSNYHSVTPQTPQQRSQSFDGNIHRAAAGHQLTTQLSAPTTVTGADDVMVVQFPIALVPTRSQQHLKQSAPPPPPPRDPQRKLPLPQPADPPRPMSYAFESGTDYSPHERFKQYFQPAVAHGTNLQSLGTVWAGGYQRRSGSDNQIQRLQSFSAAGPRPRPNSVTPDGARLLPSPQQSGVRMVSLTPPEICPSRPAAAQQQLQYFADQFPRSRRPIHIQYNGSGSYEQPYLSDSQVVTAKPQETRRHPAVVNATDFWRQKEQEAVSRQRRPVLSSGKPPLQHPARGERSRSNSPHHRDRATPEKSLKLRVPSASFPVRSTDSVSSLSGQSDLSSPVQPAKQLVNGPVKDGHDNSMQMERKKEANSQSLRPLSMVMESSENQCRGTPSPARDVKNNHLKPVPPAPPQRRFSRQSSTSSIEASEWMGPEDMSQEGQKKRRSTNLEDALSELEAIYNSLRLGDDDLLDRAERRDAAAAQQKQQQQQHQQQQQPPQRQYSDGPLWGRGAESDSGFNYGYEPLSDGRARRTRAPPLSRRSGVPDIVTDDMAYRRLNPKERSGATTPQQQPVGSYMAATPALAGLTDLPPAGGHPDATLDDVIFRNIRHANNTLRVVDPQPPFGIPIGPVSPAPNSDYLHATPSPDNGYRPNFKPRKIPDVVKDDLAYRNLRKDSQKDSSSLPCTNDFGAPSKGENSNFSLRKKRAVRSLSANLMGLVNREQICLPPSPTDQDFEKAQSLSDLPDALQVAQKILEGKGVIGGGAVKLRELSASPPITKQQNDASTVGDRTDSDRSKVAVNTSTETLTDSRINLDDPAAARRRSWQQRLRVYIPNGGDLVRRSPSPQDGRKGHPQGKPPPYTPPPPAPMEEHRQRSTQIDENNLEELLNALAQEARSTSESLDRELRQLGETTANIKLRVPSPLQSPNVVAIVERQSSCKEAGEAEDDRGTTEDSTTVPADRSSLHNILSQQKQEKEEEVDGEVIRNLSCDGSVTISEIVRRRARERRQSDSAGDQLVPEVLGAAASDEEADREVARATAAAEAAAAAGEVSALLGWSWAGGSHPAPAATQLVAALGVLLAGISFLLAHFFV